MYSIGVLVLRSVSSLVWFLLFPNPESFGNFDFYFGHMLRLEEDRSSVLKAVRILLTIIGCREKKNLFFHMLKLIYILIKVIFYRILYV